MPLNYDMSPQAQAQWDAFVSVARRAHQDFTAAVAKTGAADFTTIFANVVVCRSKETADRTVTWYRAWSQRFDGGRLTAFAEDRDGEWVVGFYDHGFSSRRADVTAVPRRRRAA